MTIEQISRKIELLEQDLMMQMEGSLMYDTMCTEIAYLKEQLKRLKEAK